ncbi:acyl carrier protein [uncultured Treponema sp.]|uniref:acyl carrier protein n=1 Tax=uncultured Treponema sp. TaxID=162155 RepID=UPI0025D4BA24|nr:acyl carrier protein [uncultured Treponema sp.]
MNSCTEKKVVELLKEIGNDFPKIYESIDLLKSGVLDSLAIMQLMDRLESEFCIEIDPDDVAPENLNTVSAIVSLVDKNINK